MVLFIIKNRTFVNQLTNQYKMASSLKNLSVYDEANMPNAAEFSFGIVVAEWNHAITHALYEGCYATLLQHGADESKIHTVQVPGTFELTAAARMLLQSHKLDAVICLGCVIKGETAHNEYINNAVAQGLTQLGMTSGRACIFGVLTPNDEAQALDRAGGKHGNKGVEAGQTAIRMAALRQQIAESGKSGVKIGF
jgi:6,7-dimethyl-8-ribityllumazine synthase